MTISGLLMTAAIGLPLLMSLACACAPLRRRLPSSFAIAALPALAAAVGGARGEPLTFGQSRFALHFMLDLPGAVLLGSAALLWIFAGVFAARYVRGRDATDAFVVCWFIAMTGSLGVFLAADLIGLYLMLAVLSIGASGLVLQGDGLEARYAGALYLGVALVAEAILLAGLVLLAQATPAGSLLLRDAAAALPASPRRDATLVLLLVGLGIKAGLVPLHFWMPHAYRAAPIPAAAVLSGAAVKASVIALLRLLPFDSAWPVVGFGLPLAALGMFTAFYGAAIGITQSRATVVLAYSSVSQMGFLIAVTGMGLAAGDPATVVTASFYAAHHLLAKGTLFLAVGMVALTRAGRLRLVQIEVPATIIALGLGGLPLTGGALAKYAAKDLLGGGLVGAFAVASSVATTLLMLHFVRRLNAMDVAGPGRRAPAPLAVAWLAMVLASLVVPWWLYLAMPVGTPRAAVAPAALWSALWPVLAGAALAIGWNRWGRSVPSAPVGDVGGAMHRLLRAGSRAARLAERTDALVRRWPVSCLSLLLAMLLFIGLSKMAV
jgi:formate hydrogenlyase subunit 3/multisubunit Na+/H+ antiporter MnhD subunit